MIHEQAVKQLPLTEGGLPGENCAGRTVDILLVEDNPGDVRLVKEALRAGPVPYRLHVAEDGVEAMDALRNWRGAAPRPDIILLDLNLPKLSGRAVLGMLKEDPALQKIPVIVLTSSDAEDDIVAAYGMRANCYVRKPIELDRFVDAIHTIERFWLELARLPTNGS